MSRPGVKQFSESLSCLSARGTEIAVYLHKASMAVRRIVLFNRRLRWAQIFFLAFYLLWQETTKRVVRTLLYNDIREADAVLKPVGKDNTVMNLRNYFYICSVTWKKSRQSGWGYRETR